MTKENFDKVTEILGTEPISVQYIMALSGLSAPDTVQILTILEIRGISHRHPGNCFSLNGASDEYL